MIVGIMCTNYYGYIGKDNNILYHLSEDLKNFSSESLTSDYLIMGAKTFDSLPGKDKLPGRRIVVLTSNKSKYTETDRIKFIDNANDLLTYVLTKRITDKILICGGAKIYELFADYIDSWIITLVKDTLEGDTAFRLDNLHLYKLDKEFKYCSNDFKTGKTYDFSIRYYNKRKEFTDTPLYKRLKYLGIIPNGTRSYNIGKSDYAKYIIQPWSIWIDYNLNPFDADIIKRVLRTKDEPGLSKTESRILDYEKIIHICNERIRQLKESKK